MKKNPENSKNSLEEAKRLRRENRRLKKKVKMLEAMIDFLRKERFGSKKKKKKKEPEEPRIPKKKGAPFGHKGVTRKKPEIINEEIIIPDPLCCPDCGNKHLAFINKEEHIQEEIILPKKKAVKYIRNVYKCEKCKKFIRISGEGEMPKSYIGPQAKAVVNYLRYDVGISQHKLRRILKELFELPFHQTSVAGFETQLRVRGQSLYNQMRVILNKMKLLYIDETGWKKNGLPYWLWCLCNNLIAYYHIDKSRGGKVIKSILGKKFSGIIISDFLAAYNAIESKKQKCLPHLSRIINRLQPSCEGNKEAEEFCRKLKEIVKQITYLFKHRKRIPNYIDHRADIIAQCKGLLSEQLSHKKADRLRNKLQKNHQEELYKCLFHPSSDSNNNFVERMLRPNVIMRKLTFGNRSVKGIKNHAVITSLLQTAKLNNHYPPRIFYQILTKPSEIKLANLIRGPC